MAVPAKAVCGIAVCWIAICGSAICGLALNGMAILQDGCFLDLFLIQLKVSPVSPPLNVTFQCIIIITASI